MAFKKGHKTNEGNPTGNLGTKTKAEFLTTALKTGLANHIHNEELEKLEEKGKGNRPLDEIKALVTPVTVRSVIDKKDITSGGESLGVVLYPQKDDGKD